MHTVGRPKLTTNVMVQHIINKRNSKPKSAFTSIMLTLLLFSYLFQYSLSFLGLPEQLHSTRVSAIILIICAISKSLIDRNNLISKYSCAYKSYKQYVKLCLSLLVFSCLQYIIIGKIEGVHLFEQMLNIILFSLPVIWAIQVIFKDLSYFMKILLWVGIIQSIIIVICLSSPNVAQLIDLTFNRSADDWIALHRTGYAGGIGCITSSGVVRFSLSLVACVYLYIKEKRWVYLGVYIALFIVSSFIARTGLLYGIIGLFFILKGVSFRYKIIVVLFLVIASSLILCSVPSDQITQIMDEQLFRYTYLYEDGLNDAFFSKYFKGDATSIPMLNLDTFFGTGMVSGKAGNGQIVNVDGGYLRLYSAIGLLCTLVYYLCVFSCFYNLIKRANNYVLKCTMLFLTISLVIAEFKEMAFISVWALSFYFSIAMLVYKPITK